MLLMIFDTSLLQGLAAVVLAEYHFAAKSLQLEISSKGANFVLRDLYKKYNKFNCVLKKIASGDKTWLKVAIQLRGVSDSDTTSMLKLAVGEALGSNPENVFSITIKSFPISDTCGGPDIDDIRFNSLKISD